MTEPRAPAPAYDPETGVITIYGQRYAAMMFEQLAFGPPGTYFRIDDRADGKVTLRAFSIDLQRKFDAAAGLKTPPQK